jgi:hypothetical protein
LASEGRELKLLFHQRNKKVVAAGTQDRPAHDHLAFSPQCSISRLNGLDSVAQPSKIIERLNFQRLRRFWNSDDKDLVPILFHSLVNVCKTNEVIFRDQGIFASIFVVDGDRRSCAHRNFPQNYLTRYCRQGIESF